MLTKIISGDTLRKSRLHDEKGNFVGLNRLFLHAPAAIATGLLRLSTDYRPALPWISYSAINELERFLTKSSRVLEFGSGMSTIWYARHAGEVCSVEDYKPWFDKVREQLNRNHIDNVKYEFAATSSDYSEFMSDDPAGFDLIMIDGSIRNACIARASKLLKPGGILYLDNSDKDSTPRGGDMRLAEEFALRFANDRNAAVTYFTDFAPTQLFVQQGLMVKLSAHGNGLK
jgi:hypothetical protein